MLPIKYDGLPLEHSCPSLKGSNSSCLSNYEFLISPKLRMGPHSFLPFHPEILSVLSLCRPCSCYPQLLLVHMCNCSAVSRISLSTYIHLLPLALRIFLTPLLQWSLSHVWKECDLDIYLWVSIPLNYCGNTRGPW